MAILQEVDTPYSQTCVDSTDHAGGDLDRNQPKLSKRPLVTSNMWKALSSTDDHEGGSIFPIHQVLNQQASEDKAPTFKYTPSLGGDKSRCFELST